MPRRKSFPLLGDRDIFFTADFILLDIRTVNVCLFYRMLLRHVRYWLDKFSQLNLH